MYTNLKPRYICRKTPFSALVILTTAVRIRMYKLELLLSIFEVWQSESFTPEWQFTENNYPPITQVFELENLQCFTMIKKNRRPSRHQTYIHPRTVIPTRSLSDIILPDFHWSRILRQPSKTIATVKQPYCQEFFHI